MKIAFIGAGALASVFGSWLSKHNEVYMIDVDEQVVEHINRDGILLKEVDGTENCYKVKAFTDCSQLPEKPELVILLVKNNMSKIALEGNRALLEGDTKLMTLQNGGGNDKDCLEFVKPENLFVGVAKVGSKSLGPGKAHNTSNIGVNIGSLCGNDAYGAVLEQLFCEAGFNAKYVGDPYYYVWDKLFLNVGYNAVCSIFMQPQVFVWESKWAQGIVRDLVHETVLTAAADGYDFDEEKVMESVLTAAKRGKEAYPSMLQDVLRKRRTEVDKINGFVSEKGREYGIPTPVNDMIVRIIHGIEDSYGSSRTAHL